MDGRDSGYSGCDFYFHIVREKPREMCTEFLAFACSVARYVCVIFCYGSVRCVFARV